RHQHDIRDGFSIDFYVGSIFSQARSFAFGAVGFTPVAREHHPVLDFVGLLFKLFKKAIQPLEIAITGPQQFLLFVGEIGICAVYREVELDGTLDQALQPLAHFFAAPGGDCSIVYGSAFIGDDQIRVDTDDAAITLAAFAGSV